MPIIRANARTIDTGETPACGPYRDEWLSAPGLTQFGAYITELPPGSASSIKHWHSAEDELILVMEGEVTLEEGASETLLHPGDAATFKAGTTLGHRLVNRGETPVRVLVVGTRSEAGDVVTYPDHDRIYHRDGKRWTDHAGNDVETSPYATPQQR